jgi:hypothetical protein
MKHLLLLLLFGTGVALPAAQAQQAATATTPPQAMYGVATIYPGTSGMFLVLSDGTTPNPKSKTLEENGKDRRFEDEAAILNFLYAQGWEVLPTGIFSNNSRHYMLKRRPL